MSKASSAQFTQFGELSKLGPCGGGLALGMTEFAYPLVSRSGLEPPAGLREETP